MTSIELTPTSFIVLGFVSRLGEASPYDLKGQLEAAVGNFWSVPHSQVYSEPARLASAGYLTESQEPGGRRRKQYALTAKGREALRKWLDEPSSALPELRDLSLLKVFFGGDVRKVAGAQLDAHREQLAAYERIAEADTGGSPRGPWQALDAGIAHEREWVRFWSQLAGAARQPDRR